MFNQLTPAEVVSAIGVTARAAARTQGPTSDFERDQLMSAYSATRHLAVELSQYAPELRRFTDAVHASVRASDVTDRRDGLDEVAARLEQPDPYTVGTTVCELLDVLRDDDSPAAQALRGEIHVSLRRLADREVDLLADALG
jgi:hypothetical protein